jgi:hypothetical protein
MREPLIFGDQSGNFSVQVSYRKVRGRGLNAPERLYGSDGIFQIAVTTEEGVVVRLKGLPFQSKINWEGRSASVASQSADIEASTGEGIVVDYTTTGYRACSTGVAVEARGNRQEVERRGAWELLQELSISGGGDKEKLRRVSGMGYNPFSTVYRISLSRFGLQAD